MTIKIGVNTGFSDSNLTGRIRVRKGVVEVHYRTKEIYGPDKVGWRKAYDYEICALPSVEEHVISWDDIL